MAEARREALAQTLEENQSLHELNDQLQGISAKSNCLWGKNGDNHDCRGRDEAADAQISFHFRWPGERDRLSESFLGVSAASESLKVELAKFSKLNETLEEENRLLKEALGLDPGDDDEDEEENDEW